MRRLTLCFLLFTSGLCAQGIEFVDDLIGVRPSGGPLRWIERMQRVREEAQGVRIISGEQDLLHALENPRVMSRDVLTSALDQVAHVSGDSYSLLGEALTFEPDTAEAVKNLLELLRARRSPTVDATIRLVHVADGQERTLIDTTQTFDRGETVVVGDTVSRHAVCDFEVEIAQASVTANPVVIDVHDGAAVALRVRPALDTGFAIVECLVRRSVDRGSDPIDTGHEGFTKLDRLDRDMADVALVCQVARGGRLQTEWSDGRGGVLRLDCQLNWKPIAPTNKPDLVVHSSPALAGAIHGFGWKRIFEYEYEEECEGGLTLPALVESILERVNGPEAIADWGDEGSGCGTLILRGDNAQALDASIQRVLRALIRPARLEIVMRDVADGGGDVRSERRFSAPVICGRGVTFGGGGERSVLCDWDVEVAQAARIPDPFILTVGDGHFISANVGYGAKGPDRVDLRVELDVLEKLIQDEVALNVAMTSPDMTSATGAGNTAQASRMGAISMPQDKVVIERPVLRRFAYAGSVQLENGTATLRRTAREVFGPGRSVELVVSVK